MNIEEYWTKRYLHNNTGWDIGYPSTPLKFYIDQLKDKETKILIPGAGNSYEAEYLHLKGYTNVHVIDISEVPLQNLKKRVKDFPSKHLIHDDFFNHKNQYDIILEQTFFCALPTAFRKGYTNQIHKLLRPEAKLVGVLFNREFDKKGPPYGGSETEYRTLFSSKFHIDTMALCYNSIPPREGAELFVIMSKL